MKIWKRKATFPAKKANRVSIFSVVGSSINVRHKKCQSTMKVSVNIKVKSNVKCIIWCLMLMSILKQTEAGSCREASLCCNGRDSSCVVQKTPINVINEDPNVKPCYCDHACLKLGDCCEDFKSHCGGKRCRLLIEFLTSFSCCCDQEKKIYSFPIFFLPPYWFLIE